MKKQIIILGKNGALNCEESRRQQRVANLNEQLSQWSQLAISPATINNRVMKRSKRGLVLDTELNNTVKTLTSKIVKMFPSHYGVTKEEDVTEEHIKDICNRLVSLDDVLMLAFCKDPSKQSMDQAVQLATLRKYVDNFEIESLPNGKLTLHRGDLKKIKVDKHESRSIDFKIHRPLDNKSPIFNVFAKYTKESGSNQRAQSGEVITYLNNAKDYISKHPKDRQNFIALLDGKEAESDITKLMLNYNDDRIFIGNCEQVIDFLNGLE
jgi:hypothetical protein